jgi:hypothetical protein
MPQIENYRPDRTSGHPHDFRLRMWRALEMKPAHRAGPFAEGLVFLNRSEIETECGEQAGGMHLAGPAAIIAETVRPVGDSARDGQPVTL